jgi:mitochondrial fission protein ELM1
MQILLKDLIKEAEEADKPAPLQIQCYVDMDGVLVNMNKGFKKISGGFTPEDLHTSPELKGDKKAAKKKFWQLINNTPNFWLNLEPMPDAKVLWDFIKDNFKTPPAVILSAGQGADIAQQKTAWIRKNIDPSVKVIIASVGEKKPEYILPSKGRVTNVLVDDMEKNITAWDNQAAHRIGILHTSAASSINQLKAFIPDEQH